MWIMNITGRCLNTDHFREVSVVPYAGNTFMVYAFFGNGDSVQLTSNLATQAEAEDARDAFLTGRGWSL